MKVRKVLLQKMSQIFKCNCNACGQRFNVNQGGGMTYVLYHCDGCGKALTQPRKAPRPDRTGHKFPANLCREFDYLKKQYGERALMQIDGSLVISEIPNDQIQRFTTEYLSELLNQPDIWSRSGDSWDEDERKLMLDIVGDCMCGGKWHYPESTSTKPHNLHRCPNCKSKNYEYSAMLDIARD